MATASTQTVEAPTQPGPRRRGLLARINFRQFGILAALVIIIVLMTVLMKLADRWMRPKL